MEIQLGGANEPHPLIHTHRHLHHVGRMQVQADGPKPACTANALLHERSADALTPGLGCDGQKAYLRAGERTLMRSGESGSRGVQDYRPKDDSFLFSHDLLGRRYVRQRGQDILPVSFPAGRRHNGCILLKSRKGYLSGGIAVFTASIPYLQLILLFRPSMGHGDEIFPLSTLGRLEPGSTLKQEIGYQALKCESSPLASFDNFWFEAISHFTFPDLLFTELQGLVPFYYYRLSECPVSFERKTLIQLPKLCTFLILTQGSSKTNGPIVG